MERLLTAALQEVAIEGTEGCPVPKLWVDVQVAAGSSSVLLDGHGKQLLWQLLLKVPGINFLVPNEVSLASSHPSIQSFNAAEKLGLYLVAPEALRDSALGLYDFKVCDARLSKEQRQILERVAKSRTKGITQSQLAKEFKIEPNKMFYLMRMLESRGLVVRHTTIVRTASSKPYNPIVATNLVHLTRYAKDLMLSSYQRFEILNSSKCSSVSAPAGVIGETVGEQATGSGIENEFMIKDDLPALRIVCENLEDAEGKVLVVSDLKVRLGYRLALGHRTWRRLVKRLQDAGLVEIFNGKVDCKVVSCIRLLKPFDCKVFQYTSEEAESELVTKGAKRGQVTELVTELPIDHQIYRLISTTGAEGLYMMEVWKRLGLNNKRNYYRVTSMLAKEYLVSEAENHRRSALYRLKTAVNLAAKNVACEANVKKSVPTVRKVAKETAQKALKQVRKLNTMKNGNADDDFLEEDPSLLALGNSRSKSTIKTSTLLPPQISRISMTTTRVQREHRVLEKLQKEGFVLRVVLHRWLEGLENRKDTVMDRKTLTRLLQDLQRRGLCKCILLNMPGLTNCGRQRTTEVILLPSMQVDPELLTKVHEGLRKFDMESRGHGISKAKEQHSAPILTGVTRIPSHQSQSKSKAALDLSAEKGRSLQANGFIPAKMVRVRMLHRFLCAHMKSLPAMDRITNTGRGLPGEMVGSCKVFGLLNAIQLMPFELFLQVVGVTHEIQNLEELCKQGLRLCDLPNEDQLIFLDSNATGRLSWLVDVLSRLKLVRLVMGYLPSEEQTQQDLGSSSLSAVLTYALEGEPFLEEPAPEPLPPLNMENFDPTPRAQHQFNIVNQDGLDAYWQTLEYFFAGAQPEIARCAFPGSSVPELFGSRSWTTLRIMSIEQRTQLLKRINAVGSETRHSHQDCAIIAKELNLSVEQVLRVSYERNRISRLQALQKEGLIAKKRANCEPSHVKAYKRQCLVQRDSLASAKLDRSCETKCIEPVVVQETCMADAEEEHEEDDEDISVGVDGKGDHVNIISNVNFPWRRSKRFCWSERLDRALIICYAIHRAMLGALYNRVDWRTLKGLPAPPQACRRRMAQLRLDLGVRKAIMSLCSLLAARYVKHKHSVGKFPVNKASSLTECGHHEVQNAEDGCLLGSQCASDEESFRWDNVNEPFIAAAIDEVIRCNYVAKACLTKRGSTLKKAKRGHRSALVPVLPSDTNAVGMCNNDCTLPVDCPPFSKHHIGRSMTDSLQPSHDELLATPLSTPHLHACTAPSRKVCKRLQKALQRSSFWQDRTVDTAGFKSIGVASAVELVKLVLLNTSKEIPLCFPLVSGVQRCKEADIFSAVKYLQQRGFLAAGQSGQIFVLSSKFFNSCSVSGYPIGTGSECAATEAWLHAHRTQIQEAWVSLPTSQQAGQLSHLLALVSSEDFSITPILPTKGIGESEESSGEHLGKRKLDVFGEGGSVRYVKSRSHFTNDSLFAVRRERGFSGITVALTHTSIPPPQLVNSDFKGKEFHRSKQLTDTVQDGVSGMKGSTAEDFGLLVLPSSTFEIVHCFSGISSNSKEGAATDAGLRESESVGLQAQPISCNPVQSHENMLTNGVREEQGPRSEDLCLVELNSSTIGSVSGGDMMLHSQSCSQDSRDLPWLRLESCVNHWSFQSMATDNNGTEQCDKGFILRKMFFTIEEAGEEGLSCEQLREVILAEGSGINLSLEGIAAYVHALEAFQLVYKVNAFDHVCVLSSSKCGRFYLHIPNKEYGVTNVCHMNGTSSINITKQANNGVCKGIDNELIMDKHSDGILGCNEASNRSRQHGTDMLRTSRQMFTKDKFEKDAEVDEHVLIVPWLTGDGVPHEYMQKSLTRRVVGLVMLNPGISEDSLLEQLDVLNPMSARLFIGQLELDGHLSVRYSHQAKICPPKLLCDMVFSAGRPAIEPRVTKHYFANFLAGLLL